MFEGIKIKKGKLNLKDLKKLQKRNDDWIKRLDEAKEVDYDRMLKPMDI